jgi:cytoskeleton protein RodZ
MSSTLGEKLRQAREQRGFTISEVAEQTRIAPLYIESIENDDYSALPGGIFNKGFVKSFAKFVGVNEQEALQDYSALMSLPESGIEEHKSYRPQVLTDDRSARSSLPTIVAAVVILGLLTGGVLLVRSYLTKPADDTPVQTAKAASPTPSGDATPAIDTIAETTDVPSMETLRVDFNALSEPVSLAATSDGKYSSNVVTPGTTASFEPKQGLKLSYSRSLAQTVQLLINGKEIKLPATPQNPKRVAIEFEINRETLPQIWKAGAIFPDAPVASPDPNAIANTQAPPPTAPARTPPPRPTPAANTNAAPANSAPKPPANAAARPTPRTTASPAIRPPLN